MFFQRKTTYIVSGFMRSGTSMMMACLEAGGLDAARDVKRDALVKLHSDEHYSPNVAGLYELRRDQLQKWDFPKDFQGRLVKCLWGGLPKIIALDGYKIIFMRRHPEEIRQSYEAFFGQPCPFTIEQIDERLNLIVQTLALRKDVDLIQINYRDVVKNPRSIFEKLKRFGFPIDSVKAASLVDSEQVHFRIERLTINA